MKKCKSKDMLLNHFLENLFKIDKCILGDFIRLNQRDKETYTFYDSVKSKNNKLNIIKKLVVSIDRKDSLTIKSERIERIKFINKFTDSKQGRLILNFKVYRYSLVNIIDNVSKAISINKYSEFSKLYDTANFKNNKKNFNLKTEEEYFAFVYLYNPLKCNNQFFVLSSSDLKLFFSSFMNKKLKSKYIQNFMDIIDYIPKKILVNNTISNSICLKLFKVNKIKNSKEKIIKNKLDVNDLEEKRDQELNWLNTQIYIKIKFHRNLVDDPIY